MVVPRPICPLGGVCLPVLRSDYQRAACAWCCFVRGETALIGPAPVFEEFAVQVVLLDVPGASVGAAAPVGGALVNRSRPWQTGAVGTYGGSNYGNGGASGSHSYGSSPYGGSSYGGAYGSGVGGMYGGSAYGGGSLGGGYGSYGGSSMYGRPVGAGYGGTYGGGYGSTYGSGNAYGGGYGTGVGAYGGGGMYGQPYGAMAPYGSGGPGAPAASC